MDRYYSGDHITGYGLHTDITTCNIEETQSLGGLSINLDNKNKL